MINKPHGILKCQQRRKVLVYFSTASSRASRVTLYLASSRYTVLVILLGNEWRGAIKWINTLGNGWRGEGVEIRISWGTFRFTRPLLYVSRAKERKNRRERERRWGYPIFAFCPSPSRQNDHMNKHVVLSSRKGEIRGKEEGGRDTRGRERREEGQSEERCEVMYSEERRWSKHWRDTIESPFRDRDEWRKAPWLLTKMP